MGHGGTARRYGSVWPARDSQGLPAHRAPRDAPGSAAAFSGTFKSPNGQYSIAVLDTGIELKGPGGKLKVTGGNLTLEGTVALLLNSPILSMNGGCTRAMRQNGTGSTPSASVYTC